MFLESEAIIGTMTELMNEHGLPSLSVHDSLIVSAAHVTVAFSILERWYEAVSGINPELTVRVPSGLDARCYPGPWDCVPAHSIGIRSRVHSVSAFWYAFTASSSRAVPTSRSPSVCSTLPRFI